MSAAPSVEALSTTITSRRSVVGLSRSDCSSASSSWRQFQLTMHTETSMAGLAWTPAQLRPSVVRRQAATWFSPIIAIGRRETWTSGKIAGYRHKSMWPSGWRGESLIRGVIRRHRISRTGQLHVPNPRDPFCHDATSHDNPRRRRRRRETRGLLPRPISTSSSQLTPSTPPPAIIATTICSTTCRQRPVPPTESASRKPSPICRTDRQVAAVAQWSDRLRNPRTRSDLHPLADGQYAPLRAGPRLQTITLARASICC